MLCCFLLWATKHSSIYFTFLISSPISQLTNHWVESLCYTDWHGYLLLSLDRDCSSSLPAISLLGACSPQVIVESQSLTPQTEEHEDGPVCSLVRRDTLSTLLCSSLDKSTDKWIQISLFLYCLLSESSPSWRICLRKEKNTTSDTLELIILSAGVVAWYFFYSQGQVHLLSRSYRTPAWSVPPLLFALSLLSCSDLFRFPIEGNPCLYRQLLSNVKWKITTPCALIAFCHCVSVWGWKHLAGGLRCLGFCISAQHQAYENVHQYMMAWRCGGWGEKSAAQRELWDETSLMGRALQYAWWH